MQRRILFLMLGILLIGCGQAFAAEKPQVFVSIIPQKYFVQKIAGDLVDVSVMVLPGAEPATYEPSPRQMADLEKAKAYFSIGVPFEATWLKRITAANPKMVLIRTDADITKRPMVAHRHHDEDAHQAGHEAAAHGILDPHIWLAPELVRIQVKNICNGLIKIDPANKVAYETNLKTLLKEIDAVDTKIKDVLAPLPDNKRAFMVFHPAWAILPRNMP